MQTTILQKAKPLAFLLAALLLFCGSLMAETYASGPLEGLAIINTSPPVTSTINVTDTGTVSDVTVTVNVTHTYAADLQIYLVNGDIRVHLMGDNGGGGDNLTNTRFDDGAEISITAAVAGDAPFTNRYIPLEPLATFLGSPIEGDWALEIADDAGGDTGTFDSWSIDITPNNPEAPGVPMDPSPASGMNYAGLLPNFTWVNGINTESVDAYFSTVYEDVDLLDVDAMVLENYTDQSYQMPNSDELDPLSTYYWRVVAKNSTTRFTTNGRVWSFTTADFPIGSMPYTESFENGTVLPLGWLQASGTDDIDWDLTTNTYGINTGTDADHTTGTGYFLNINPYNNASLTAELLTPPFEVDGLTMPAAKIWYHMWGVDMGSLEVDVYDMGTGEWTADVATIAGDQGDAWLQLYIDLDGFQASEAIVLRFRGTIGATITSDICLDDFWIGEAPTGPEFVALPSELDLGDAVLEITPTTTGLVSIINNGIGELNIQSAQIINDDAAAFSITASPDLPLILGASEAAMFSILFAPETVVVGGYSADLEVVDANRETHLIPLTGYAHSINCGGGGDGQGGYYFANSTAEGDQLGYQPAYWWSDISETGEDIGGTMTNDSAFGPVDIGFDFTFFGNTYSELYINDNARVMFADAVPTGGLAGWNSNIPATYDPNNFISLFWETNDPTSIHSRCHIYYGIDELGNFVITYEDISYYNTYDNRAFTGQIVLSPNGRIKLQFKSAESELNLNSATVGIENADGTAGIPYHYNLLGIMNQNQLMLIH